MVGFSIDVAKESDVKVLYDLTVALAMYERKQPEDIHVTEAALRKWAFGPDRIFEALIARWDGEPVGMATYYTAFCGYLAAPLLYLEDMFVLPNHRGKGTGTAILQKLALITKERGYCRMHLSVFNWNETALRLYEHVGMTIRKEIFQARLDVENMDGLLSIDSPLNS